MNVVIYCRVSSKEQVEGTSLESQELACKDYAVRNHMEVIRVFVERGESAKFADRTQLLELMTFCGKRENGIERLLVWKVDRLARNVGDHFNIKAGLLKQNIRVISVTEPIDANPEGRLLETILAGFAQFDNDLRAARTLQGMRRKLQDGLFPWKPPLGYRGAKQPGNKKTEPDQPDQPTFGLLQQAWNEFATGRFTKAEILRITTSRGLRTRAGKLLPKQTLDDIFRDTFYAGVLRDPWSGEEHIGRHLPMVSREIFDRVQRIVASRSRSVPHRSTRPELPLRTFARCTSCERFLTGSFVRGRSRLYPYYHCFNRSCCVHTNHPLDQVHDEFVSFLEASSPNRVKLGRIKDYIGETAGKLVLDSQALEQERVVDTGKLKLQQQQLIRMKMEQMISDEEFLLQRSILHERLVELDMIPSGTERKVGTDEVLRQVDAICEPLMHLGDTWSEIAPEYKRRFQLLLLPVGYVMGRLGTAHKGRFFSAFATSRMPQSIAVPLSGQSWNQLAEEINAFAGIIREAAPDAQR